MISPNTPATRILLRSSWQTANIGDIAHTPGMLALLEKYRPDAEIILWPNAVDHGVEEILLRRFPKLRIAKTPTEQARALEACDFLLHGSGPGLAAHAECERARLAGKPYGIAGVTLKDEELSKWPQVLAEARFVFCRDSDSLHALEKSGIPCPRMGFGPDATFALDLRDEPAAGALLAKHGLEKGAYLCTIPRLRWTPYWEIYPEKDKPHAERIAVNQEFAEKDHAKAREAITAWVRTTGMRVLLAPEMSYAVPLLRPLLYDKLPDDVKPRVAVMDHYWLTAEAASVYARAAAVLSFEQHSPIMAIAAGVPALLLRQPTDTRKGRMWYDIGLTDWVFEIDQSTGPQIAERLVQVGRDLPAARALADKARRFAHERMAAMIAAIP